MESSPPHGIRSNPDVFRRCTPSRTGDLGIRRKRPAAITIDTNPAEGELNVAYLVGTTVYIFQVVRNPNDDGSLGSNESSKELNNNTARKQSWNNHGRPAKNSNLATSAVSNEEQLLKPLGPIRVDDESTANLWTGLALGGDFLAVWGTSAKGTRPLLRVMKILSTRQSSSLDLPYHDIPWFDADKRVAVSCLGYVALICHRKVITVNLNLEPPEISTIETPRTPQPFTDIAFNDTGDLLYAWATASIDAKSAGLFVCGIDKSKNLKEQIFQILSKSYYKASFNDSFDTELIPYNTQMGCIVAADNQYYYPAFTSTHPGTGLERQEDSRTRQPRIYSEAIRKSHLKASIMYNNHSLIAIQRAGTFQNRDRLVEHPLHLAGDRHCFGDAIELAKLEMGVSAKAEIKSMQVGGHVYIFIFNLDGRYEVLLFEGPSDFRETPRPEADGESRVFRQDSCSEIAGSSATSETIPNQ